jgi:hypothetical protein
VFGVFCPSKPRTSPSGVHPAGECRAEFGATFAGQVCARTIDLTHRREAVLRDSLLRAQNAVEIGGVKSVTWR